MYNYSGRATLKSSSRNLELEMDIVANLMSKETRHMDDHRALEVFLVKMRHLGWAVRRDWVGSLISIIQAILIDYSTARNVSSWCCTTPWDAIEFSTTRTTGWLST